MCATHSEKGVSLRLCVSACPSASSVCVSLSLVLFHSFALLSTHAFTHPPTHSLTHFGRQSSCGAPCTSCVPTAQYSGTARTIRAFAHMAYDTFALDPVFIVNAFVCTGLFEGKSLMSEIIPQVREEFVPTVSASWTTSMCMSPIEYCVFAIVPPAYRVLAINCNDVVWNAIVSFFAHRRRRADALTKLEATVTVAASNE